MLPQEKNNLPSLPDLLTPDQVFAGLTLTEGTRKTYARELVHFGSFLQREGLTDCFARYRDVIDRRPVGVTTKVRALVAVRHAVNLLYRLGYLERDVTVGVRGFGAAVRKPIVWVRMMDIRKLFGIVDENMYVHTQNVVGCMLALLSFNALRSHEVLALKVNDVDMKNGIIHITGKRGKMRHIPIAPETRRRLRKYFKSDIFKEMHGEEPLFSFDKDTVRRPVSYSKMYNTLKPFLMQAGMSPRLHSLRRFGITQAYNNGGIYAAKDLAGHSDMSTTALYMEPSSTKKIRSTLSQIDRNMKRRGVKKRGQGRGQGR